MKVRDKQMGFANVGVLLCLIVLGAIANMALLLPVPYPLWSLACFTATVYRIVRVARA